MNFYVAGLARRTPLPGRARPAVVVGGGPPRFAAEREAVAWSEVDPAKQPRQAWLFPCSNQSPKARACESPGCLTRRDHVRIIYARAFTCSDSVGKTEATRERRWFRCHSSCGFVGEMSSTAYTVVELTCLSHRAAGSLSFFPFSALQTPTRANPSSTQPGSFTARNCRTGGNTP